MSIDLAAIGENVALVAGALAALLAVKALVVLAVARLFGLGWPAAIETALVLAGAGEFAFVLFSEARSGGVLPEDAFAIASAAAALSMLLTPLLAALGRRLSDALHRRSGSNRPELAASLAGHVILLGYGRVGEAVGLALDAGGTPWVAIDLDAERVAAASAAGRPVHFGDASRVELLDRLGGSRAAAFVATADRITETERALAAIRRAWPAARLFARARDPGHAERLVELGAVAAVPEAFEASLILATRVLRDLGLPDDAIDGIMDRARANARLPHGELRRPAGDDAH